MSSYSYFGDPPPTPGKLLTKSQLATQHPGTDYKKYVNYVTRTRAKRAAARQAPITAALGPLAALLPPPGQAQHQAESLYPTMSEADITRRARDFVTASLNPIVQQITSQNQASTSRGIDWINAYAQGAAKDLGEITPQIGGIYDKSIEQQGALDKAFQAGMTGAGQQAGQQAEQQMAAFGQGGDSGLAQLGAGAGFAEFGAGGATTANLISDRAANMSYAAKQPGIASAVGQQQLGDFTMQQAAGLRNAVGQVNAQAPGMIQSLMQDYQTQNQTALANRAKYISDQQSNVLSAGLGWQGVLSDKAKIAEAMKEAQLSARTTLQAAGISERGANARAAASETGANTRAALGEAGATARTRMDNAYNVWATKYKVANPTVTSGQSPLSPSNIRTFQSGAVKEIKGLRNRTATVPVIASQDQSKFDHWAKKGDSYVPIGKDGKQLRASKTGKTQKVNVPTANNTAYDAIFTKLMSQFAGVMDPRTNKGWYINQIAAIAQGAGYSKATFDNVSKYFQAAIGAAPAAGTKTTTTAPKPTATTPKPTATAPGNTGGPVTNPTDTQTKAAARNAEKWTKYAGESAGQLYKSKVPKAQAVADLTTRLKGVMPIAAAKAIAARAINHAYPGEKVDKSGMPKGQAAGSKLLAQGAEIVTSQKQKDGSYVMRIREKNGRESSWKVYGNQWTKLSG